MSYITGSPEFNRHLSFSTAIGANNANLSSLKVNHAVGGPDNNGVDDEQILLSIPKGLMQGRQVVLNPNYNNNRDKKII